MTIHDFHPQKWKDSEARTKILQDIEDDVERGIKYILIEAPTGIGKSWIAATAALWKKEVVILTPQKILQNQYDESFDFMKISQGKSNFLCKQLEDKYDCSYGDCKGCDYYPNNSDFTVDAEGTENETVCQNDNLQRNCPYWVQRKICEKSSFSVYSYAMYLNTQLTNFDYSDQGPKKIKKILICDEAEQLEDMLSGQLSLELKENLAKKIGSDVLQKRIHEINLTTNIEDIKQIIDDLILEYEFGIGMLESDITKLKDSKKKWHHKHKEKKDYEAIFAMLKSKISLMDENWVVSEKTEIKHSTKILLESVVIKKIAQKLFDDFEHVIFLSATLNDDFFLKELGIEYADNHMKNKDYLIPESMYRLPAREILNNDQYITADKKEKIHNLDKSVFIKFSFQTKEFFARLDDLIPFESIPYVNSEKKLKTLEFLPDEEEKIEKIEKIEKMNRTFSYRLHSYPNPIPVKNRQIEFASQGLWLHSGNSDEIVPKMVKEIERILKKEEHVNQKGIIHVTSFDYQRQILENLSDEYLSRIECVIDDDEQYSDNVLNKVQKRIDKDDLIKKHDENKKDPVVILSPSCWFGVDLKDDSSRFQIIVKYPILPLSTKNTEKIEKLTYGPEWFDTRTAYKFIQGCGRSIRNVNDHAMTYLLDSNCELIRKNNLVRPWFLDSFPQL
jgi:Rad3-related DNA helicase